jgi:hypothetical protein
VVLKGITLAPRHGTQVRVVGQRARESRKPSASATVSGAMMQTSR